MDTTDCDFTQLLSNKILDVLKHEFDKKENKERINCIKDNVLLHIVKIIHP